MEQVEGRCPACHSASLFLAVGNHVTCGNLACPNPTAVADALEDGKPLTELLTLHELAIIDSLADVAVRFGSLPQRHPSDREDFAAHIHILQRQVMARAARRAYPQRFPSMGYEGWAS